MWVAQCKPTHTRRRRPPDNAARDPRAVGSQASPGQERRPGSRQAIPGPSVACETGGAGERFACSIAPCRGGGEGAGICGAAADGQAGVRPRPQAVSAVHALLSDAEKRKTYDETGEIDDDDLSAGSAQTAAEVGLPALTVHPFTTVFRHPSRLSVQPNTLSRIMRAHACVSASVLAPAAAQWTAYWRQLFPKITVVDIDKFSSEYKVCLRLRRPWETVQPPLNRTLTCALERSGSFKGVSDPPSPASARTRAHPPRPRARTSAPYPRCCLSPSTPGVRGGGGRCSQGQRHSLRAVPNSAVLASSPVCALTDTALPLSSPQAYAKHKSMLKVVGSVMLATAADIPRFREILGLERKGKGKGKAKGKAKAKAKASGATRPKRATRAKKAGGSRGGAGRGGATKKAKETTEMKENNPAVKTKRQKQFEAMTAALAAKYCKPKAKRKRAAASARGGKSKRGRNKSSALATALDAFGAAEPSEEAFLAARARLDAKKGR